MLLYLSESKLKAIIEEINLFHKESVVSKYFDSAEAKLELKILTVDGRVQRQDRNSLFTETDSGILDCVSVYLKKEKKLHIFTPTTKRLEIMHLYEIKGMFSLNGDDNPDINMQDNKTIFEYMMKNPNEITTLSLTTPNKTFPIIKIDCSNKNIWFMGSKNGGENHLKSWSLSQRWDLKFSKAIVQAIVYITKVDDEMKIVYGSPLYITI